MPQAMVVLILRLEGLVLRRRAAPSRRPRPEEARSAVSKDEDEPLRAPSCFETHRIAANLRSMHALLRCDAPQHEGGGWAAHFGQTNPTIILAKRSQAAAW